MYPPVPKLKIHQDTYCHDHDNLVDAPEAIVDGEAVRVRVGTETITPLAIRDDVEVSDWF
jgi:hypothetical protein